MPLVQGYELTRVGIPEGVKRLMEVVSPDGLYFVPL
jgi:hypothetical protein